MSKGKVQECFDAFVGETELSNVEEQDVIEDVKKRRKKEIKIGTNLGDLLKNFLTEKTEQSETVNRKKNS
jgi:polyhydroxyalkanoate synthesis regulator phasin